MCRLIEGSALTLRSYGPGRGHGLSDGPAKEFKKNMLLSRGRDAYRTRIRQALTRAIGPSVIEEQRPMIRQLVKDLLQKIDPDKESDLLHDFAFSVPASLFCLWFGAPLSDAPLGRRPV